MSGATPALAGAAVRDAPARLLARIDGTADLIRPAFPHAADGDTGCWQAKPGGAWTDGFWVGLCWLAYRLTGADRYRAWGLEWAARLRGREETRTHDVGFLFQYAAVLGWETTRALIWGDYFLPEALTRWPASDR